MLPDGSGAGRGGAGAEPAVEAPEAPTFSLDELNRCRGQLLGGGAFGKVYAINGFPGLAVKEIYLNGQPDRLVEITKFELEALSKFSHPGVLKYHRVIKDGDFFYIVMDRYDGDLQHFIADHRKNSEPIPRGLMLSIVRQLADALTYVHAPRKVSEKGDVLPGIVHRDLKPANVLMNKDCERVVLADFGLCKDAQHDGSTLAGTPLYMAPEVFIHRKTSRASDIWALGVIVYELVTLALPSFSHHWEPEKAKEFFVDEWKPDLSAVKDEFTRMILEKIFVLDPIERPTAGNIAILFQTLCTSANELATQDPVSGEGHRSYIISDSSSSKISFSWTPLIRAITDGDIKAVKKHLSKKGKKDNRKDMALIIAARAGHEDVVELLDPTDKNGVTALMRAAERGNIEAVRALVAKQKRLRDKNGKTALMWAARWGHREAVEVLLEHEKGLKDTKGITAFTHALRNKHVDVATLLRKHEAPSWTLLMCAAFVGDIELAKSHLSDKDKKNSNGDTALMIAARAGHEDVVELLDPTDEDGVTALMRAVDRNDVEAVRALIPLQKGKKMMGGVTIDGWTMLEGTALMRAAACGHTEVVRLLVEHEGGMKDEDGWTALMLTAGNGHAECVKLLLEREGGMQSEDGLTALMYAAQSGHADCVKLLLERERDMKTTREWCGFPPGTAALDVAKKMGRTAIASILSG